MDNTVIGVVLIVAGLVNVNLIRVGIETGRVQLRSLNITKEKSTTAFWGMISVQGVVSALLFSLGLYYLGVKF
jgi:hypothetical protein